MEKVINKPRDQKLSLAKRLLKAFISPITLLFGALAILLACMGRTELWSFMLISMIVLVYGILRFE